MQSCYECVLSGNTYELFCPTAQTPYKRRLHRTHHDSSIGVVKAQNALDGKKIVIVDACGYPGLKLNGKVQSHPLVLLKILS